MQIPTLTIGPVTLRPWRLEDAPALLAIMQEPEMFRYFPPSPTPPSIEKALRYITYQLNHWQERGYGHWAVTGADGSVAGWNGLEFLPETDETEVAYILSRSCWGQGFSTLGARAALQYGFRQAGLTSIIGLVHPENIASIRVLEKGGLSFIDKKVYFGMEMCRYRIEKAEFERCSRDWPEYSRNKEPVLNRKELE